MGRNTVRRRLGLTLWARRPNQAYFRWIFRSGREADLAVVRAVEHEARVALYRRAAAVMGRLLTREPWWRRISLPRQQATVHREDSTDRVELLEWAGLGPDALAQPAVLDLSRGGPPEERHDAHGQCHLVCSIDGIDRGFDLDRTLGNVRAYLAPNGRFLISFTSHQTPSVGRPLAVSDTAFRASASRGGLEIRQFRATVGGRDSGGANTVRLDYAGVAATTAAALTANLRPARAGVVRQEAFPFFVGCPRSGTTLTRALFDSHPRLAIPGESNFVVDLHRTRARYETDDGFEREWFLADVLLHPRMRHWLLDEADLRAAFDQRAPTTFADAVRVVYGTYAAEHGKELAGDKTPRYLHHIDRLAALLPEARFVHIIRDGRDVALSMRKVGHERFTIPGAAWFWAEHIRRGRRAGARLGPDRYFELRYEDLVDDTGTWLRRTCDFLGLDFDERMLGYTDRIGDLSRTIKQPEHHQNLTRPPTRMRDWREEMSRDDQAVFLELAGDALAAVGYDLDPG